MFGEVSAQNSDIILYHFDQFDMSRITGHQGQCRIDPVCDKVEKTKFGSKIGHFGVFCAYFVYFISHGLQPP